MESGINRAELIDHIKKEIMYDSIHQDLLTRGCSLVTGMFLMGRHFSIGEEFNLLLQALKKDEGLRKEYYKIHQYSFIKNSKYSKELLSEFEDIISFSLRWIEKLEKNKKYLPIKKISSKLYKHFSPSTEYQTLEGFQKKHPYGYMIGGGIEVFETQEKEKDYDIPILTFKHGTTLREHKIHYKVFSGCVKSEILFRGVNWDRVIMAYTNIENEYNNYLKDFQREHRGEIEKLFTANELIEISRGKALKDDDDCLIPNTIPFRGIWNYFKHRQTGVFLEKRKGGFYQPDILSNREPFDEIIIDCGNGRFIRVDSYPLANLSENIELIKEDLMRVFKKAFGDLGETIYLGLLLEANKQSNDGTGFIKIGKFITGTLGHKKADYKTRKKVSEIMTFMERSKALIPVTNKKRDYVGFFNFYLSREESLPIDYGKPMNIETLGKSMLTKVYFGINPLIYKNKGGKREPFILIDKKLVQINLKLHPFARPIMIFLKQYFRFNNRIAYRKTETLFKLLGLSTSENVLRSYKKLKSEIEYIKSERDYISDYFINENDGGHPEDILNRTWTFLPSLKIQKEINVRAKKLIEITIPVTKKTILTGEDVTKIMNENKLSLSEFSKQIDYDKSNLWKAIKSNKRLSDGITKKIQNWVNDKDVLKQGNLFPVGGRGVVKK